MLTNKQLKKKIKEVDDYLLEQYKELAKEKPNERDCAKYEQEYMKRIKTVIKDLEPLIKKATKYLVVYRGKGKTPKLKIQQRLRLFLVKQLIDKSNRNMAYMLDLFCILMNIDISYKTVERLYSDTELKIVLHNLYVLLLKEKKVKDIDCCGDATGYSLTIRKHYASIVQKRKLKAKKQDRKKKKHFAYQFALMDLKSKMYVCYGMSLISEKRAFDQAMKMLKELNISMKSIRLDKYYSFPCYVKQFPKVRVYILPRKDAKLGHGENWLNVMKSFVYDTQNHLEEYYKRNNSENGFGVDKKLFGWGIRQKRADRIDTAGFSKVVWHNLINLHN